jgi:hypothetical protein
MSIIFINIINFETLFILFGLNFLERIGKRKKTIKNCQPTIKKKKSKVEKSNPKTLGAQTKATKFPA